MLINIYKQIWNRWRSNSWLFIELLLVFCLIWYIVVYLFGMGVNYSIKNNYDLTNVWELVIHQYPEEHPQFKEEENEPEKQYENYNRIIEAVKQYSGVETVGISFYGLSPGKGNNFNNSLTYPDDSVQIGVRQVYMDTQYDFFDVFRYTRDGSPVRMSDFDWSVVNGIVINKLTEKGLFPKGESAVGKTVYMGGNENAAFTIIGVIDNTKQFDFVRPQTYVYIPQRVTDNRPADTELIVRVNGSFPDTRFKEDFLESMTPGLQTGNFYLADLISFKDHHKYYKQAKGVTLGISMQIFLVSFLLINIILCLFGTFLYRSYLRKNEVGIRMAVGSSRNDIIRLFIAEAICLVSVILLPALLIEYQFVHTGILGGDLFSLYGTKEIYLIDHKIIHFLITNGITLLIMAMVCIVAVYIPAKKVSELNAADALHYE